MGVFSHNVHGSQVLGAQNPSQVICLEICKVPKTTPWHCGQFTISHNVGNVAYKVRFPKHSKVHPMSRVICLRI